MTAVPGGTPAPSELPAHAIVGRKVPAPARLTELAGWEAFVHGVFAIAITLLVLDIHVPPIDETPTASALIRALVAAWPRWLAYVLSFMYVGAYWVATHRTLRMARGLDSVTLGIGLLFLLAIAVVPFVSALLAEYVASGDDRSRVVSVLFIAWQLVTSMLAWCLLLYASRAGLLRPDLDHEVVRRWLRLGLAAPLVWAAATVAALVVGVAALAFPVALLPVALRGGPEPNASRG